MEEKSMLIATNRADCYHLSFIYMCNSYVQISVGFLT